MQLVRDARRRSSVIARNRCRSLAARAGSGRACTLEALEQRQHLALSGVVLGPLPLGFFDASGQTNYDAATHSFDIVATPTSLILPTPASVLVSGTHGDAQVHVKVDASGNFVRGVTSADTPSIGSIDPAGHDFIYRGSADLDGDGLEASETDIILLTGEAYAFGWEDSGGPSDNYDFRFVVTGGALAGYFGPGQDLGLTIFSEASTFAGDFSVDFHGAAKGTFGPIAAPPPSSLAGAVYCDRDQSGSLTGSDVGIGGVEVHLTGTNDAGQAVNLTTFTLPNGTYSFPNLRPGSYSIDEVSPSGALEGTNTVGNSGGMVTGEDSIGGITLPAGVNGTSYNFGYICLSEISGTKYRDITGDGLSGDDAPLGGTTIFIDANNDGDLDLGETFTTTAPDGTYSFTGLVPGVYVIREVVPAGMYRTAPFDSYTVVVTPGTTSPNRNFANAQYARISGTKFRDITGNGLSGDDAPLGGTTIFIDSNNDGDLDPGEPSTVTGPDGSYAFNDLRAGSYTIREVIPAGYYKTHPVDGYLATLSPGDHAANRNFANAEFGKIRGTKYKDKTGNGVSGDDTPLGGTTIFIDSDNDGDLDPGEPSTVTLANGSFSFNNLVAGNYVIREVVPAGMYKTFPADGYVVTLSPGQDAANRNFANAEFGKISGTKYKDKTGDGVSGDDTPLGGTTIFIDTDNDGDLDPGEPSAVTGANGTYAFDNLVAGNYVIREIVPAGYVRTTPVSPVDNYLVTLSPGQHAAGRNFANTQKGKITGKKFKDLCADGVTSDDTPLSGVTIFIDSNNDGDLDPGEPTTVTGADGSFTFDNLMPGTYTVREVVPAGYYPTAPSSGKHIITLNTGDSASNKNFANAQFGKITGKKYLDITGNGYSSEDTGFAGVVVYIDADNDGRLDSGERSTTTAANGSYSFENLFPGTYIVREVVPAGYIRTGPVLTDKYTASVSNGQTVSGLNFTNAASCDCYDVKDVQFFVNGKLIGGDLRGKTLQGDVVTVVFTILPGQAAHPWTLVSYTAPSGVWDAGVASDQRIYDIDTGIFGPGTHSLMVNIPDCYYQIDFVCGLAIDRLGPDGSNIFYTAQKRLISADNGGTTKCIDGAASISGAVWLDDDNDGVIDAGEMPIEGAKITLSWVVSGVTKTLTRYTDADGKYWIGNLKPGSGYKITESQPSGYADGKDKAGSAGGTLGADMVSAITLGSNVNAINYNFGERNIADAVGKNDTAAISFWVSTAGQNLIKSLNGSSGSEALGVWLGERFPNLFGQNAGVFNLMGKTNSQIGAAIIARNTTATNLEAQVFATALSVYVTNSAWAGGTMATSYGFTVNLAGSGLSLYNTGSNGTALGLTNNSSQTLLANLRGANAAATSGNGMIYSGNATQRTNLFNYFKAINTAGAIA